jgi:hypothetical protein
MTAVLAMDVNITAGNAETTQVLFPKRYPIKHGRDHGILQLLVGPILAFLGYACSLRLTRSMHLHPSKDGILAEEGHSHAAAVWPTSAAKPRVHPI